MKMCSFDAFVRIRRSSDFPGYPTAVDASPEGATVAELARFPPVYERSPQSPALLKNRKRCRHSCWESASSWTRR